VAHPLGGGEDGERDQAGWEGGLDRAAEGFLRVRERYGSHAVYGVASGRAPHEAAYTMQKFIRGGFGTNHIDNCSRA